MKFETKARENYAQVFLSVKIPFFPKTFRLNAMLYSTPDTWVHGYSSRTKAGRYVLLLDYDNLGIVDVVEELMLLQQKFKLSDFHVFKMDRENSFHACCLDTFHMITAYDIIRKTSSDQAFINSVKRLRTREWILRWGAKGKRQPTEYLRTIKSKSDRRLKSTAHGMLLKKFGAPVNLKKGEWDGIEELGFVDYNTANRTEGEKKRT